MVSEQALEEGAVVVALEEGIAVVAAPVVGGL